MEDPALGVAHVRRRAVTGGLPAVAHRSARPADPAEPVSGCHRLLDAVEDRGAIGAAVMLAALPVLNRLQISPNILKNNYLSWSDPKHSALGRR